MAEKSLFISYSHKDSAHLETLKTHLKPLERLGLISPWFDGHIIPGDDIDEKVGEALKNADIVALLVSPDFLASDYCIHTELAEAMRRHEAGTARVVPIILRKCEWEEETFGRLLGLPTDNKAIMSVHWADKDEAWNIVAKGIKSAARAESTNTSKHSPSQIPSTNSASITATRSLRSKPLPMPVKANRELTDEEIDDFKHKAFEEVAQLFEASVLSLEGMITARYRRLDANRFTATLYLNGKKKNGITVYIGGDHYSAAGINFHMSDDGRTNTLQESLKIEMCDGEPSLWPSMSGWGFDQNRHLSNEEAARHIWSEFVKPLDR
jgi:hypothetical protein